MHATASAVSAPGRRPGQGHPRSGRRRAAAPGFLEIARSFTAHPRPSVPLIYEQESSGRRDADADREERCAIASDGGFARYRIDDPYRGLLDIGVPSAAL